MPASVSETSHYIICALHRHPCISARHPRFCCQTDRPKVFSRRLRTTPGFCNLHSTFQYSNTFSDTHVVGTTKHFGTTAPPTKLQLSLDHHHHHHHQTNSQTQPNIKMPSPAPFNPRQRLSLLTNSTLGHDVSAAFKASSSATSSRSSDVNVNETPAPPPSPVDFSFPSTPAGSGGRSPVERS